MTGTVDGRGGWSVRGAAQAAFDTLRSFPVRHGRASAATLLPELDGLRSLAILSVLTWHAALRAARYLAIPPGGGAPLPDLYRYFPHGEIGVALFFAISGFVVSQPLLKRPRASWSVTDFYRRRLLRIYPPYLVTMLLCWAALAVAGHRPTAAFGFEQGDIGLGSSLGASLLFLHGLAFDTPSRINPPMWSIEVEVLFYLLVPVLLALYVSVSGRAKRVAAALAVLLAVVALCAVGVPRLDADIRARWALPYHLPLFILGIVAADLASGAGARVRRDRYDLLFLAGACGLLLDGLMLTACDSRPQTFGQTAGLELLTLAAVAAMLAGGLRGRITAQVLGHPWIGLAGVMCYSVYLTHIVTMTVVSEAIAAHVPPTSTAAAYALLLPLDIGLSLAVGTVFYLLVERRLLAPRRPGASGAPTSLQRATR